MPIGSLLAAIVLIATAGVSAQGRGTYSGGGGSSTFRIASPGVVASWSQHDNWANGASTSLLVLWRGTPGWPLKRAGSGGGSSSSGRQGGSGGYQSFTEGGLTFSIEFDYDKSVAKILGQEISLNESNVVLVDFVDSPQGPAIVGRQWVEPPPAQPEPAKDQPRVDPIAAIVRRTPELFEYLRCDVPLPDGVVGGPKEAAQVASAMMALVCSQMRPPQ